MALLPSWPFPCRFQIWPEPIAPYGALHSESAAHTGLFMEEEGGVRWTETRPGGLASHEAQPGGKAHRTAVLGDIVVQTM